MTPRWGKGVCMGGVGWGGVGGFQGGKVGFRGGKVTVALITFPVVKQTCLVKPTEKSHRPV